MLAYPDVVRLKAVEDGEMIGFAAGDPRPSEGFSWIATIGVAAEYTAGVELGAAYCAPARHSSNALLETLRAHLQLWSHPPVRAGGLFQDGCLAELL